MFDPVLGGDFHLEAGSLEAALEDVRRRTGREPEVLDVETVTRGGVGGFFARELVRVHVRIRALAAEQRVVDARPQGVDGVLQALTRANDDRERGFEVQLRRALLGVEAPTTTMRVAREVASTAVEDSSVVGELVEVDDPVTTEAAADDAATSEDRVEVAASVEPERTSARRLMAPDVVRRLHAPARATGSSRTMPARRLVRPTGGEVLRTPTGELAAAAAPDRGGDGGVATGRWQPQPSPVPRAVVPDRPGAHWSRAGLDLLGVPAVVLDGLPEHAADELGWLHALAEAVGPWCRPLPTAPSVLAGPRAAALGEALGLPTCNRNDRVPYGGHVALVATDAKGSRAWLHEVRGDRWLHLVLGGGRWEGLVDDAPLAVSVAEPNLLPEALALCVGGGLALGHQLLGDRASLIAPLDVALALRAALRAAAE